MRKINTFFFVLILTISMTSCSSDDNSSNDTSGDILGTWNAVSVDFTGTGTLDFQGQSINLDIVGESYDEDFTVTFSENPNIAVSEGSYSISITISALGEATTQDSENLTFIDESQWSKDGDELTFITDGESTVGDILELTENSMIISLQTVEDVDGVQVVIETITVFSR